MKTKILFILAVIASTIGAFGQTPNQFNYQSVVRDASGNLIINQNIGLQKILITGEMQR